MGTNNKGKIGQVLQAINIIPLLIFGMITLFVNYEYFTRTMYAEVEQGLRYVAHNINTIMEITYPGDYKLVGEDSYRIYKGENDITTSYEIIDEVKTSTELDITIFYQDTRILTTILDSNGSRFIGTRAPDIVIEEVLNGDEAKLYNNTIINGYKYFSYYMPIHNSDGTVVGMIFVGKPSSEVNAAVQQSLYPSAIITIISMIIISFFLFLYTRRLVQILQRIRSFLMEVATGNLTAELDSSVSNRNDEFGDIGRSALSMQRSLRTMVEQDALTELFNRRCADRKLKQVIAKHQSQQTPFSLAIGDIDFFKKVNDSYGHDCGDMVLKNVSAKLREHMRTSGFVARWGGEEFLLVFDHADISEAHRILDRLLEDIRSTEFEYEGSIIRLTMTFGLTAGNTTDISTLLRIADDRLYIGKTTGRNRIIWEDSEPEAEDSLCEDI